MSLASAIILLLLVMDGLGNVPLFLAALAGVEPRRRTRVIVRELLIALLVLLVFLLVGPYILTALQISEPALTLAGGVVLFLIALRMIFPTGEGTFAGTTEGEPFIVPLAIPFVAGPSALATVLLFVTREPHSLVKWVAALLIAWAITSCVLVLSAPLSRLLGPRGLNALERLMGLILTTVAVQLFLSGLKAFLAL